ncbi:MAG: fibronectin type III domain-containing protein [Marinobacter sp.]|nr:fibronectin type III domain-containing protein [Marinobacter sp.]
MSGSLIAAFIVGVLLTGCGGGSSESVSEQTDSSGEVSAQDGSAVLSWSAPLTRVNGESIPMGELDRYVIRYGQDAGELNEEVIVTNAQADAEMSYEVSGLDAGTWYFTIQVQDTNGLISEPSDVVSKSIRS